MRQGGALRQSGEACLVADCNEVQVLCEQLNQAKQVARGIKDVLV